MKLEAKDGSPSRQAVLRKLDRGESSVHPQLSSRAVEEMYCIPTIVNCSSSIFLVADHALFPHNCHVSSLGFGAEKKRGKQRSLDCMPGANDQKGKTILLAEEKYTRETKGSVAGGCGRSAQVIERNQAHSDALSCRKFAGK
jgi:hypothetical protein